MRYTREQLIEQVEELEIHIHQINMVYYSRRLPYMKRGFCLLFHKRNIESLIMTMQQESWRNSHIHDRWVYLWINDESVFGWNESRKMLVCLIREYLFDELKLLYKIIKRRKIKINKNRFGRPS